jgi:hypothetical protein
VSRNGAAWQAKLNARADDNLSEKQRVARGTLAGQVLKHNHDKLEASVVELAWILYRIQLYKSDAGAVAFKCECGKTAVRKPKVKTGLPDLIGCIAPTGRMVTVEIKTGEGRLRDNQQERAAELAGSGAAALVIHSMQEAEQQLGALVDEERRKHRLQEANA